jgi:hypothetical protein
MQLGPGDVVRESGQDGRNASQWRVLEELQATRHQTSYLVENAREDLGDHRAVLTVCRYEPRLLGKKTYVDNVRQRLAHTAEMLVTPHNVLPEPIDWFTALNAQDTFAFDESGAYARAEPVLVTEPYHGKPLSTLLETEGTLDEARGLRLAARLGELLEDLHRVRVLAYELRPEDLLVDTSDHDRLWVLGCANYQKLDRAGRVSVRDLVVPLSDFSFAAPEIEDGTTSLDVRADIYSLGALLLFVLTGLRPREVMEQRDALHALYSLPSLSPDTCRLLARCLSPSRQHRFKTTAELRVAVDQCSALLGQGRAPAVHGLTVTREEGRHVLSWVLSEDAARADGLEVLRWVATGARAPVLEQWETLLSAAPPETSQFVDAAVTPGTEVHYAVVTQVIHGAAPSHSAPAFASITVPGLRWQQELAAGAAAPLVLARGAARTWGPKLRALLQAPREALTAVRARDVARVCSSLVSVGAQRLKQNTLAFTTWLRRDSDAPALRERARWLLEDAWSGLRQRVANANSLWKASPDKRALLVRGARSLVLGGRGWLVRDGASDTSGAAPGALARLAEHPATLPVLLAAILIASLLQRPSAVAPWASFVDVVVLWFSSLAVGVLARDLVAERVHALVRTTFLIVAGACWASTVSHSSTAFHVFATVLSLVPIALFVRAPTVSRAFLGGATTGLSAFIVPASVLVPLAVVGFLVLSVRHQVMPRSAALRGLGAFLTGLSAAAVGVLAWALLAGAPAWANTAAAWAGEAPWIAGRDWSPTVAALTPLAVLAALGFFTRSPDKPCAERLSELGLAAVILGVLLVGDVQPGDAALVVAPLVLVGARALHAAAWRPGEWRAAAAGWVALATWLLAGAVLVLAALTK